MKPINNFSETFKNEMNLTSLIRGLVSFISSFITSFINEMLKIEAISLFISFHNSQKSYICNVLGIQLFDQTSFSTKGAQLLYAVDAPSSFITRTQTAPLKNNLKQTI
jgi:hypothetical protein